MRTSFGWEGKGRYGSFHSWINARVAGKTVWSLDSACHTWARLWWSWPIKRCYIVTSTFPLSLIICVMLSDVNLHYLTSTFTFIVSVVVMNNSRNFIVPWSRNFGYDDTRYAVSYLAKSRFSMGLPNMLHSLNQLFSLRYCPYAK